MWKVGRCCALQRLREPERSPYKHVRTHWSCSSGERTAGGSTTPKHQPEGAGSKKENSHDSNRKQSRWVGLRWGWWSDSLTLPPSGEWRRLVGGAGGGVLELWTTRGQGRGGGVMGWQMFRQVVSKLKYYRIKGKSNVTIIIAIIVC